MSILFYKRTGSGTHIARSYCQVAIGAYPRKALFPYYVYLAIGGGGIYNAPINQQSAKAAASTAKEGASRMCRPNWLSLWLLFSLIAAAGCSNNEGKKSPTPPPPPGVVDEARLAGRDAASFPAA